MTAHDDGLKVDRVVSVDFGRRIPVALTGNGGSDIINPHVDPAEMSIDLMSKGRNVGFISHIGLTGKDSLSQCFYGFIEKFPTPAADSHRCPFCQKGLGSSKADAGRPAGNDDDLAAKP